MTRENDAERKTMAILALDKMRTIGDATRLRTRLLWFNLSHRYKPTATRSIRTWWRKARTAFYVWPASACIVTAAWTTLPQLGWLTAGAALLALESLGAPDDSGRP
jgi:hypothetical protein